MTGSGFRVPGSAFAVLALAAVALVGSLVVVSGFSRTLQSATQQPTFRTEANYVRVDVFPTTKDGVPIQDLTQQDFDVLESGSRSPVPVPRPGALTNE